MQRPERLSIAHGIPLSEEPDLGALTLPGYLREVSARFAEREALVLRGPDGVERWSYETLWERSFQVARALVACGLDRGGRVGVLMTNRPEWLASVFGTALAGGVAVPLITFATPPELETMLQVSGVSVLLFEGQVLKKDFGEMLAELEPAVGRAAPGQLESTRFPFLRHLVALGGGTRSAAVEGWEDFLERGRATPAELVEARAASVEPSDPGALFFSSGTTGKPKGILSSHRGIAIQMWRWPRMSVLEGEIRTWSANGFFWSGNFAMAMGATLSMGGSLLLQPTFEPDEALQLMQELGATYANAWPHQWAQMAEAPSWDRVDLSGLRFVAFRARVTLHPTVTTLWTDPQAYGNTETFTINTGYPSCTADSVHEGSHGPPLPGNTAKIVDPLTGETLPLGERGELAVKGPTLMLGYVGVPLDETLDDEGFFRTGDGGYMDEQGRVFWEGRLNDIIKTGGANVSPVEIDSVLTTFPGVGMAQTVGVPHETLGEMVVSCVVPQEGVRLQEGPIRDFLRERLAAYKVPRRVLFFSEEEVSTTGSEKIIASELCERAAERIAAEEAAASG